MTGEIRVRSDFQPRTPCCIFHPPPTTILIRCLFSSISLQKPESRLNPHLNQVRLFTFLHLISTSQIGAELRGGGAVTTVTAESLNHPARHCGSLELSALRPDSHSKNDSSPPLSAVPSVPQRPSTDAHVRSFRRERSARARPSAAKLAPPGGSTTSICLRPALLRVWSCRRGVGSRSRKHLHHSLAVSSGSRARSVTSSSSCQQQKLGNISVI